MLWSQLMKKLFLYFLISILFIGSGKSVSETNREKSKIKLSCKITKAHIIKKFDGTPVDIWLDEKYLKDKMGELVEPITLEIFNKDSLAMWVEKAPVIMDSHDKNGFTYLNISEAQKKGFIHIHYQSFKYDNFKFKSETSMMIKDDDNQYNFGFDNKAEISSIGYGNCKRLK